MSSRGVVPAWVIKKQQEKIARQREAQRRNNVRKQVEAVAVEVRQAFKANDNADVRQWAGDEISFVEEVLDSVTGFHEADVDFVLKRLLRSQAVLSQIEELSNERAEKHQKTVEMKTVAYQTAVETLKHLRLELTQTSSESVLERLNNSLLDVHDALESASLDEVTGALESLEQEAVELREADHKAAVDEELRRHIISSVVKAMTELGFVVGKPKLLHDSGDVAVIGTLSSGRTVRFDVRASGEMQFDMDGFKDRTCSDSLDEVLLLMEDKFGVETGPVQHNWKNPDRISKGSKGFPTGGNTRTMGGGQG
jgi:hypothetical protein